MKKFIIAFIALQTSFIASASWDYAEETDAMTSKRTVIAYLQSSNTLDLDFPYKGKNHGVLQVRQHPKYGLDVIFSVEKGQLQCNRYQGCAIEVRFDDGPAMTFSANEPADNSSTHVFLQNAKRFIASASKAKRILVQVTMFRNGSPVLEFRSANPLVWPQGSGGAKTPSRGKEKSTPETTWPTPGKLN